MKRVLWACCIALGALQIGLFAFDCRPSGALHGSAHALDAGFDFSMRRNEAICLLDGVNPYDVWTGKAVKAPFYPYAAGPSYPDFHEPINAYTPWEYAYALGYAALSKCVAWRLHCLVMLLSLALIAALAARYGGVCGAIAALLFFIPINIDLNSGNYALVVTAAVALLCYALDRGNRWLAALCWAVAMVKPQMSILLAIPLLMKRRWGTCLAAGTVCLILTLPPAWLCHVSPLALIAQAPAASAHAFDGCALFPAPLLRAVHPFLPDSACMALAMLAGLILAVVGTRRLRDSQSWIVLTAPCLLSSLSWTYVQSHSYLLAMPVAAVFAADMMSHRTPGRLILGISSIALWARLARGVQIVVDRLVPQWSAAAECACALSATAALALSAAYLWRYADSLKGLRLK